MRPKDYSEAWTINKRRQQFITFRYCQKKLKHTSTHGCFSLQVPILIYWNNQPIYTLNCVHAPNRFCDSLVLCYGGMAPTNSIELACLLLLLLVLFYFRSMIAILLRWSNKNENIWKWWSCWWCFGFIVLPASASCLLVTHHHIQA